MNRRSLLFLFILLLALTVCAFSQQQTASAAALRDYVGLINQTYHPGIVSFFEKIKSDLAKQGEPGAVKAIDIFLSGAFGSGFIYSDARGNLYAITNNHVVAQAHTLAITFERQDGFKKKIENLKIIAVDEEADLAILAFPAGEKPVAQGLTFITRAIEEGEDVFSAGFPGLGITPLWQFGRGMVSNASARFPKSVNDETIMGPFIQHTAQIDAGNSGGPLLVLQRNVPSGYAVAGVNMGSGIYRQAANYAIPISTLQTFISGSLNPKPETFKAALDTRLAKFVEGLGVNKAVYPHIAEYLSTVCIGENAEFAMSEMFERGSSSVRRAFVQKCEDGVVEAMSYAVAWTIENRVRGGGNKITASIKEVTGGGDEYTVVFTMNNKDINSTWIREYGNWRIKTFSDIASGDVSLIEKQEAQRKAQANLRLNSNIHLEAGYATLFDRAPAAVYLSAEFMKFMGVKMYFAGSDFWAIGMFVNYRWDIQAGNLGFIPYVRFGLDYQNDKKYNALLPIQKGFPVAFMGQVGLKITSSYVPGLFLGTGFQFNLFDLYSDISLSSDKKDKKMKMALAVTIGYAF